MELTSNVRHNDLGKNPFLCVICISWEALAQDVIRMINCGIDHLVTAPLSPQQILSRGVSMVHHKLPLVVTADYVGPDRQTLIRPGKDYPIVDASNSLKEKTMGRWDSRRFEREKPVGSRKLTAKLKLLLP
jgi:hypothetical protein